MIYTIIVGAISGYLAGMLLRGKGFGFLLNILIGIIGGVIGGLIFRILGFWSYGIIAKIISSVLGAFILFWFIGYLNNRRK